MMNLWIRANMALNSLKKKMGEEHGAIEMMTIIIIVGIIVALALVFRDRLTEMVDGMFNKTKEVTGF